MRNGRQQSKANTVKRNEAIREENAAMDELARLSREIETVNLLIVHFRQRPQLVRRLSEIKARLLIQRSDEMARRAAASLHL